jgi:hypothetical protein
MKRTITVFTEAQVEVDLRKFSTDILLAELAERNESVIGQKLAEIRRKREDAEREETRTFYIPALSSADKHPLHGIYYSLKFGKQEHAIDLLRDYLGDLFGVVL